MMTKAQLRKIYLERQKSLSDAERSAKSRLIADQLFENFDLKDIQFLHVFLPIEKNKEIKTSFILERLWSEFPAVTVVVPRVNFETMKLENLRLTPQTKLFENRWRISEPAGDQPLGTEKIDACLIPLLCFDKSGFRVGYGKGFYDKFLSECRADCLKIGLSYDAPIEKISDAQSFDVKLDFCIVPDEVFT